MYDQAKCFTTVSRGALSPRELAERWNKTPQHIYNEIGRGRIKSFKTGRSRLIPIPEIERIERGGHS